MAGSCRPCGGVSWSPRLRLRGLPFAASEADIRAFLQGFELAGDSDVRGDVEIIRRSSDNLPTGHALVYFKDWEATAGLKCMWTGPRIGTLEFEVLANLVVGQSHPTTRGRSRFHLLPASTSEARNASKGAFQDVSSMQSKLKHFRKQRAEVEIANLCLKTGEWLDHLVLCKALQYWQLAVLTQITWHRHSELEVAERRVVRHARSLRKVAQVQSRSDDFRHTVSCSRVCFGAWARTAALLTAQKVIETARKQVERQQSTSMDMLSREKARLADTVFLSMTATFGARDASDSSSSGRFLVKRCFPWWRRQAAYMAAKQRILRREASNLKLQEDMRRCGQAHQRRWASWAASSKLRRQHWQHVREAFEAWSGLATAKPSEDPIDVHGRTLFSAELALSRQPFTGRVVLAAWRRISQEEKAMSLEKQTRELEAQLARAACEKALSVKQLEQRLAFQDDEGGQVSFEFQALQTQKFEERLRAALGTTSEMCGDATAPATPTRPRPSAASLDYFDMIAPDLEFHMSVAPAPQRPMPPVPSTPLSSSDEDGEACLFDVGTDSEDADRTDDAPQDDGNNDDDDGQGPP
ncbi:unnamed protein product [Symbiodinium sp. CCMP2456]|nr:unnamed protein product [Symbiodinium sp. CCMP2456]